MSLAVTVSAVFIVLSYPEPGLRLSAAAAALSQAPAMGLLARDARLPRLYSLSLLLVVVGAVVWGWALLAFGDSGNVRNREVVVLLIAAVMTRLYGGRRMRRLEGSEWYRAARSLVPWLVTLYIGTLLLIFGSEVSQFASIGRVDIDAAANLIILAALFDMLVTGLRFAALPGKDPLNLSERGRMAYVYASEAILVLLMVHLRFTMPWLFGSFFEYYWPVAIMVVAFAGVTLSEFFHRKGKMVLADPLERTGIFLPLLPVLGFWVFSARIHYSGVLVTVGLLYGLVSIMRRSFGFSLLACRSTAACGTGSITPAITAS
jgi:hypothetical protein